MQQLAGRTAFVTGGASGIGLALGRAFAEAGMQVMLADIEIAALDQALDSLRSFGSRVQGIPCDVADAESVERAANATVAAFGKVHVLCNNAGVAGGRWHRPHLSGRLAMGDRCQFDGRCPRHTQLPAASPRP